MCFDLCFHILTCGLIEAILGNLVRPIGPSNVFHATDSSLLRISAGLVKMLDSQCLVVCGFIPSIQPLSVDIFGRIGLAPDNRHIPWTRNTLVQASIDVPV